MTNNEAAKWIQLYIDLANIDPTTGEEAYLNEDARKTLEAMGMAVDALIDKQAAADRIIDGLPSAQSEPHYDEWCDDCKEYDKERHCCPRWNRVIRQTLKDAQPEQRYTEEELRVFKHGISLSLLSKRSSQHWQYDEDTATEIKFLERLYEKVSADMRGEQDE